MAEGKQFVDSLVNDLHSQTLSTVVDVLLSSDSNLTTEQKARLSEGQKNTQYGFRTQVDNFKDDLLEMWHKYDEPQRSIQDVIGEYEGTRINILDAHHRTETFHVANARKMGIQYIPSPPPRLPNFDCCYKQIGNRFFALNLANGTVIPEVLLNPIDFQLLDIRDQIIIDSHDKSLNVLESTRNILQYASKVGMPKQKIADLLKNMIHQHDPDNYGVFNFIHTPLDVFTSVISMVSYTARLESIKKAVARITRQPRESLEIPMKKYCSLLLTASSLECPNMSNSEAIEKTQKQAIRAIDFLIEDTTKHQLHKMKQEHYTRMNQKSTLSQVISFVVNIESDPRFQLQSPKSLVGQPVNFSLYHTDTLVSISDKQHQESDGRPHEDHSPHSSHIQQHGGSHQHFYGGKHIHGAGSFRPWSASHQGRHEYLPQRPHQSSQSYQDDHHHRHDQQHQHDLSRQGHETSQHQHQQDSRHMRDFAHYDDGPPTPPELRNTEYVHHIPDIYYKSTNGTITKLERKKLWIKDSMGGMHCLDDHYTRFRSPSPDMDNDKQDEDNTDKSANKEEESSREKEN